MEQLPKDWVYGPVNGPLDNPAAALGDGPLYMDASEVDQAIGEGDTPAGSVVDSGAEAFARRSLLKGFGATALLSGAACVRRPAEKVLPYVNQPVDHVPGVPVHYATTCGECSAGCGVVVKTREGRPVKVEGHGQSPVNQGALCSVGQGTLQGLYHPERRTAPMIRRDRGLSPVSWDDFLLHLGGKLKGKSRVGILTSYESGSKLAFMQSFLEKIGSSRDRLFVHDGNSLPRDMSAAHELAFGVSGVPRADLAQAEVLLGIGTDFLDVGISPVHYAKAFRQMRQGAAGKARGTFVQFESHLTQTGSKADKRFVIPPGSEGAVLLALLNSLINHRLVRGSASQVQVVRRILLANSPINDQTFERLGISKSEMDQLADELLAKKSAVLAGSSSTFDGQQTRLQLLAVAVNAMIGAYGRTVRLDHGWFPYPSDLRGVKALRDAAGELDALIICGTNPAFSLPSASGVVEALTKIPVVVSLQTEPNETDALASHVGPAHHFLEAWGDAEPMAGVWTIRQPAVRPVTDSRQSEDVLLWIAAHLGAPMGVSSYRDYLRGQWRGVFAASAGRDPLTAGDFDTAVARVQRHGLVGQFATRAIPEMRDFAKDAVLAPSAPVGEGSLQLLAPLDVRLRDGQGANKPVLQEAGDTLTSIAWDSWVALAPATVKSLGLRRNDVVKIEGPGGEILGAVYPLPGLHGSAVVVHRGNGHGDEFGRVASGFGVNPLRVVGEGWDSLSASPVTSGVSVKVSKTGQTYRLAAMQKSHEIGNRTDIVRKISVSAAVALAGHEKNLDAVPDMYPALPQGEYRWGMAIDLSHCTGCSACVVACAQENNIAQVGRTEILNGREMHWIRLDRYFEGSMENPQVTVQPMLCQHCNHAPCEAVCPVYATTHDSEGLNSQTYNRCVGTRYCANACPYKVRRFNWFTHRWNQVGELERDRNLRALNPDITVRTRGIMEKCTFCIQRIRDAKHLAKQAGRQVRDGEVRTACQQTCPSDAIEFGNLLDPSSRISRARRDGRAFLALGGEPEHGHFGIKTLPNVNYMMQIVPDGTVAETGHGGGAHHG